VEDGDVAVLGDLEDDVGGLGMALRRRGASTFAAGPSPAVLAVVRVEGDGGKRGVVLRVDELDRCSLEELDEGGRYAPIESSGSTPRTAAATRSS
jgi:hypothetical protein